MNVKSAGASAMRAMVAAAMLAVSTAQVVAQSTATPRPAASAAGATVSGTVRDSISNQTLGQAIVQLVSTNDAAPLSRTANADSAGHFNFPDVPDGQYKLGFFHPMLDSLGIEAPLRDVFVDKLRPVRMDLAIPSPATLSKAFCRQPSAGRTATDAGGVVVGFVRDGRTKNGAANATVMAQWAEMTFSANKGIERRMPRQVVRATNEGFFVFCDVPSSGPVQLLAMAASDSTDRIEVVLPADRFMRRDLYVGPSLPVLPSTLASQRDSAPPSTRRSTVPSASANPKTQRMNGVVVTALGGQPIAGAEVRLVNGEQVRANQRGEWAIPDMQVGTRMLELRAVGYYPVRKIVDVVEGSAPVRVELVTLKSVLDTVQVRAAVVARNMVGFNERQRSSSGKFITAADIERRRALVVTEMFNSVPGMRLQRNPNGGTSILIRGLSEDLCEPNFFIDGADLGPMSADDVDAFVRTQNVAGIEIYAGAAVPGQFSRGMAGNACGSVVIWTK